jgi:hypothetical protein
VLPPAARAALQGAVAVFRETKQKTQTKKRESMAIGEMGGREEERHAKISRPVRNMVLAMEEPWWQGTHNVATAGRHSQSGLARRLGVEQLTLLLAPNMILDALYCHWATAFQSPSAVALHRLESLYMLRYIGARDFTQQMTRLSVIYVLLVVAVAARPQRAACT